MKEVRVDEMQNGGPDRVQGQTPVIRLFNEMPQKPWALLFQNWQTLIYKKY